MLSKSRSRSTHTLYIRLGKKCHPKYSAAIRHVCDLLVYVRFTYVTHRGINLVTLPVGLGILEMEWWIYTERAQGGSKRWVSELTVSSATLKITAGMGNTRSAT